MTQERLDGLRKLLSTGRVSRNNTPRRQNEENNSPVYTQRSTRKRSTVLGHVVNQREQNALMVTKV